MQKRITVNYRPQIIPLDDYDKEYELDLPSTLDSEILILRLRSVEEVQLLLLRFMGFGYKEIVKIMNLKSIGDYYVLWRKLREDVEKLSKNQYN